MTSQEEFEDYARRCGSYDLRRGVIRGRPTYLLGETNEAWMFWGASRRHMPRVGTARMYAEENGLDVTVEWMRGWTACLDAIQKKL